MRSGMASGAQSLRERIEILVKRDSMPQGLFKQSLIKNLEKANMMVSALKTAERKNYYASEVERDRAELRFVTDADRIELEPGKEGNQDITITELRKKLELQTTQPDRNK